ncbi:MAG: tRNA (guanosine(37)-N1)-methyltransferase TrmD [Planctomycetota bacterium]
MTIRFDIITLFPAMFTEVLGDSILGNAVEKGLVSFHLHNLRDHTVYNHKQVDDRPFGGGPGMLIMPDPVFRAVEAIEPLAPVPARRIMLAPAGRTFNQAVAHELVREERILLLCGRYEGFDRRVNDGLKFEELSIGDFIISGGELAAMVVIEAVTRLVPGVLGNVESNLKDSFSEELDGVIEYPQYTRPAEYRGMTVPDVLISGDHAKIAAWRREHTRPK